jgi:hypothetical protein
MPVKERCALSRANRVFRADEKRIRTKNAVMIETQKRCRVFIQDRRLRTDGFFIRAQSGIRADGTPAAQDKR